jgi:hypothetical protein
MIRGVNCGGKHCECDLTVPCLLLRIAPSLPGVPGSEDDPVRGQQPGQARVCDQGGGHHDRWGPWRVTQ